MQSATTAHTQPRLGNESLPWFFVLLIFCWYGASTMNAVATQEFVAESQLGSGFQRDLNAMLVVTITQLLVGALLGSLILFATGNDPRIQTTLSPWLIVPALHAMGSLFTNMGFTYGSASIVQVIKLLEPVETLLVAKLLGSTVVVSGPIFVSLAMLIGGTVGTLSGWEKPPTLMAVLFASLSGISLATRNAAKKRFQEKGKASGFVAGVKEFVNLSVWGAISLTLPFLLNSLAMHGTARVVDAEIVTSLISHPKMIVFHGLYNLSSLAVLGYVSALTHSVMNVGKRMTNIVVASIFFSEKLSLGKVGFGLAIASAGMLWYTALSKGVSGSSSRNFNNRCVMRMLMLTAMFLVVAQSFLQQVDNLEASVSRYNNLTTRG